MNNRQSFVVKYRHNVMMLLVVLAQLNALHDEYIAAGYGSTLAQTDIADDTLPLATLQNCITTTTNLIGGISAGDKTNLHLTKASG
jgi:hypothetical protein